MARASSSGKEKSRKEQEKRPFPKVTAQVAIMDNYKRVSSSDVISRLKGLARGWDAELEGILGMPKTLFESKGGASQYYSSDANFSISDILMSLSMGAAPDVSKMSFGIALHERAGTMYFVLADPERRIIVRQRIVCYHNEPPELDWAAVKDAIRAAEALASRDEAKKGGLVAVFDGSLKLIGPVAREEPGIGPPPYIMQEEKK